MLKIVPPAKIDPKQEVIERIKRHPKPSGMLQCNRCGSRTVATIRAGVTDTRRGTVIHKDICAECYKRGLIVPMITELKPIK